MSNLQQKITGYTKKQEGMTHKLEQNKTKQKSRQKKLSMRANRYQINQRLLRSHCKHVQ